jgi:outer membrane protein assembly factor BamB
MPIMFATKGKDVAVCIDAATGRTLWRKTIPGGRYFAMNGRNGSTKGWYTTNPAAGKGAFYFGTSADVEYALDADTGETIWKRHLGQTNGRAVIGDVMVRGERTLRGYDLKTGKTRWEVKDAGERSAIPARWKRGGKEYIIVANSAGEIRCVDPGDGKVLWTEKGAGNNDLSVSVRGDYLLCNGDQARKGPGELTCYRLSLKGAEHQWTIPSSTFQYRPKAAPAAMTDTHAFVRTRKPEGLAVVELKSGKIVSFPKAQLGSSGYVQWMDGRVSLQPDGSHSRTPLQWFDVTNPGETKQLGDIWRTRHGTTSSYYPILISHPMVDGRVYIRGRFGIHCYDLRNKWNEDGP